MFQIKNISVLLNSICVTDETLKADNRIFVQKISHISWISE